MIISDSHKFVFIHIPKNAGTSIQSALEPFADGQSVASRETTHETLSALLARQPALRAHFKFAFVRNPWERLVSFFFYARGRLRPTFPQFQEMEGLETMLRMIDRDVGWLCQMHAVRPQCDYVCDARGARLTTFLGRYERLDRDFATACSQIGIEAALSRQNVSRHGHYATYYSDWGRGFVADRYGADVRAFDYRFECAP
jgi:hypothetical protein